jgi:ribosome-binding factor A
MPHRQEKIAELIKQNAARFLAEASDNTSLITVTDTHVSPDYQYATVSISVYPDEKQEEGLAFAKRRRRDLHEYLKQHTNLRFIPQLTIELDEGELHRRRIEQLSRGES